MDGHSLRASVTQALVGGIAGLVLFGVLNWVSVVTLQIGGDTSGPSSGLLVGGLVMLVATFGATRYPVLALGAGLVMAGLVVWGWALAGPTDAFSRTATGLPGEALRHGAYMPLVLAAAMALLGVGIGVLIRRRAQDEPEAV